MSKPPATSPTKAEERIHQFFSAPHSNASQAPSKLDLSSCNLSHLPPSLHTAITTHPTAAKNLTQLNLAHNSLTHLPPYLAQLPNLRILFLLANNFSTIPPVISTLPSVTMLSFKSNRLHGEISAKSLPPRISWLILTSNRITSLSADFPTRCRAVRKLMLSNNLLTALPPSFPAQMRSLQLLRLANNRFTAFPTALYALPRLAWLSLAGNPCTRPAVQTPTHLPPELAIRSLDREYAVDWARPFGAGASGAAFPGTHRSSGRRVAVKRFGALAGSDGLALDEVSVSLAARGVPGVVHAVGFCAEEGEDGGVGSLCLVMERVPGAARCIAGPPSFESCTRSVYDGGLRLARREAERIVRVVEEAVMGLLARGIAHGDVYGHNVLVGEGGEGERIVVLGDLGAAWWVPDGAMEGARRIEMRAVDVFREEIMSLVKDY